MALGKRRFLESRPERGAQRLSHRRPGRCPPCPHRSRDGSWRPGGRVARTGGDMQLLLPRAQGAHPGDRGRAQDSRPRRRPGHLGALRGDRSPAALRARARRRSRRRVRARPGRGPGRVTAGGWARRAEEGATETGGGKTSAERGQRDAAHTPASREAVGGRTCGRSPGPLCPNKCPGSLCPRVWRVFPLTNPGSETSGALWAAGGGRAAEGKPPRRPSRRGRHLQRGLRGLHFS